MYNRLSTWLVEYGSIHTSLSFDYERKDTCKRGSEENSNLIF